MAEGSEIRAHGVESLDGVVGLVAARIRGLDREAYTRAVCAPGRFLAVMPDIDALEPLRRALESGGELDRARDDLARWARDGIRCYAFGGAGYPDGLAHIPDPPLVLFVLGDDPAEVFAKPGLAVVGSRRADALGCAFAAEVAERCAAAGCCIISGLALGVDGAAHRGALASAARGSTVAVFGSGLYTVYPAMHRSLATEIRARGGLLVSHFEPETRPFPANFLNRNRIIAGLSRAVLVVEAAERSGALATARYALEAGRELMVVPGSIRDPLFTGSNRLFHSGAVPILGSADVLEHFPGGLDRPETAGAVPLGDGAQGVATPVESSAARLLAALDLSQPVHVDVLAAQRGSGSDFYADLFALELSGAIARLPGNYVQRLR
jgi:DNA processing protein